MAEIKPLGYLVAVRLLDVEKKTESGFIVSTGKYAKYDKDASEFGEVLAIGPTAYYGVTGCIPEKYPPSHPFHSMLPHEIWGARVGDIVEFKRFEGKKTLVKDGLRYMQDTNIIGRVEGDNIIPLGNRVTIEIKEISNKSSGGIITATGENASLEQDACEIGVVKHFGPIAYKGVMGCNPESYPTTMPQNKMTPNQIWGVNSGDTVEFNRFGSKKSGSMGKEKFRYVEDSEIVGIVTGEVEL